MNRNFDDHRSAVAYRDLAETIFRYPEGKRIKICHPIKPSKLDKLVQSLQLADYDAEWRTEGEYIVFEYKPQKLDDHQDKL